VALDKSKPKALEDFPQFTVAAVRRGETADGYMRFELEGKFNQTIKENEGEWFYLLFSEKNSLCVTLKSLNKDTGETIVTCDEKEEPNVAGKTLAYLESYWRPNNVWMILDPDWGWDRKQFQGADAIAEDFESKDVSIIDGREVKFWTKLEAVEKTESSRYYPAGEQSAQPGPGQRVVPGGWDHEHCALCNVHVDVGDVGYCDRDGEWMCIKCYERYVVQHDLAFVDEI
jgi:hypothetical protein